MKVLGADRSRVDPRDVRDNGPIDESSVRQRQKDYVEDGDQKSFSIYISPPNHLQVPVTQHSSSSHKALEKQVSMEEQMIFGALQTLNEEAFEDVAEEQARNQERMARILHEESDGIEEDVENHREKRRSSGNLSIGRPEEIEVMYLQSSPLLPRTIVSCLPDVESATQSLASSFSPYKCGTTLSRKSSLRGGGGSTNASPKHSVTERDRPSQLAKEEKASNDNKVSFSPLKQISQSVENSPPSQRERPQSLILNHENEESEFSEREVYSVGQHNKFDDLNYLTSLPDLCNGPHIPRHLSLSEQLSASSSSSIEKIRKLTRKLHRALSGPEECQFNDNVDPEASPLVVGTPSTENSHQNSGSFSPPNCANGTLSESETESLSIGSRVYIKASSASSSPTKAFRPLGIMNNHKFECESHV